MRYVSTRGQAPVVDFADALLAGLARDGGLYVPESWPTMAPDEIRALSGLSYAEAALRVTSPFVGNAIDAGTYRAIIEATYARFTHSATAPLRQLAPNHWLLELFHGPQGGDAPFPNDGDPIGQQLGFREIVRRDDDRPLR